MTTDKASGKKGRILFLEISGRKKQEEQKIAIKSISCILPFS
ncbi:MAG: hypothetical protein R3218_00595 [Christiangramia sp.]|nr:hypothetical protein [Christiangramia sp.]